MDICYVSNILTVGSELVISFFNKGKLISLGLPFCIFVGNKIYVMEIEMLKPVVLASKHNFGTSLNCCDILSISKKQYQVISARYLRS